MGAGLPQLPPVRLSGLVLGAAAWAARPRLLPPTLCRRTGQAAGSGAILGMLDGGVGAWGGPPQGRQNPADPTPSPTVPPGCGQGMRRGNGCQPWRANPTPGHTQHRSPSFRGGAGGLLSTPGCLILLGAAGCGSGVPRGLSCCQQLRFLAPATSAQQQLAGGPHCSCAHRSQDERRGGPHSLGGEGARKVPPPHELFGCCASISPRPAACNVTIHNRCKDTLPNCTKVKQKVSTHWGGTHRGGGTHGWGTPLTPLLPPPAATESGAAEEQLGAAVGLAAQQE